MKYKSAWTLGGDMMNKKGEAPAYVMVIIGLVMLSVLFTLITASTNSTATSESITPIVNVNTTLTYDDLEAVSSVSNGTVTLATTEYTYYTEGGEFTLLNATHNNTALTVSYSYYDDGYVDSGIARLVLGFVTVIFAVGIMVFVMKGK